MVERAKLEKEYKGQKKEIKQSWEEMNLKKKDVAGISATSGINEM